ncbi:glycosyltransferase family 4 protein [Phytohabitans sp. ZYX-F-186]|uniref:Glycosyltransferase family 4 protein n=1 Tax=Phytohabitans maris TaxID=3071409 RepID=A0ABU0ZT26_9ACTN|nr:glycosyltransferase family 4 protein [Phytohabitans sp. ZYX-F-186]MDQ7909097.1 glycosyltransferase family 4 protein [Phytohabitans sp. ZYX-F-186]
MSRPLCVFLPEIGVISETFIRWDTRELLPGGTAVVADPPPRGETVLHGAAWDAGDCPVLAFEPLPGDPAPSAVRLDAVAEFLSTHQVEAVLVEYLDFADRWFDFLLRQPVRVWLRGHGVDVSARLTERRWRDAYRRCEQAAGIIVPSQVAANALRTLGLPPEKIHVVRYSVEIPPPRPAAASGRGPEVRCLAVGRLVPKKAPLLLLEAFRDAASQHRHLVLDLVGDGPLMGEVRRYVAGYELTGLVHLHGRLPHPDTLALIRTADILLHHAITSPQDGDTEGQPLAILEAMAAGLPVIATNHAGIPEAIADGVNGRLVAEHDVTAMAANLLDLADDPAERDRLGQAARKTIEERHGPDRARTALLTLLGLADADTSGRAGTR